MIRAAALVLLLPCAAMADTIRIEDVSLNYATDRQVFEVSVLLNRPLVPLAESLQVRVSGAMADPYDSFTIGNGPFPMEDAYSLRLWHSGGVYAGPSGIDVTTQTIDRDGVPMAMISAEIPASRVGEIQFTLPLFAHWTHVFWRDANGALRGVDTGDFGAIDGVVYAPPVSEPSSVALACIGVVAGAAHSAIPRWRRHQRNRRHV